MGYVGMLGVVRAVGCGSQDTDVLVGRSLSPLDVLRHGYEVVFQRRASFKYQILPYQFRADRQQ